MEAPHVLTAARRRWRKWARWLTCTLTLPLRPLKRWRASIFCIRAAFAELHTHSKLAIALHLVTVDPNVGCAAQQKDSMTMPGGIRRRVRQLPRVPVITAPLEVDLTCAYEGLPHFTHFAGNIKFVGGINQPKLVQVHRASVP